MAQIGDEYKIYGRSGGGGGHQLKVARVSVTINAIADDITDPKVFVFPVAPPVQVWDIVNIIIDQN